MDVDTRISARNPRTTATSASTMTGTSIGASRWMIQPLARNTTSSTIPAPGSALHIVHISASRARTPGARSACSKSAAVVIISVRNGRWVNRKPVHTVTLAPNRTAEMSSTATRPPASKFNGIITAAAMAHGSSRIADWRLVIFTPLAAHDRRGTNGYGHRSDDHDGHRRNQVLHAQHGLCADDGLTADRDDDRDDFDGRQEIGEYETCAVSDAQVARPHGAMVSVAGR